jgi:hypothetical protein
MDAGSWSWDSPIAPWDMECYGRSSPSSQGVVCPPDAIVVAPWVTDVSDSQAEEVVTVGGTFTDSGSVKDPVITAADIRRVLFLRKLMFD